VTPKLIDKANDISAFASSDEERLILTGIHFSETHTEATNGCVAIMVPYAPQDQTEFDFEAPKDLVPGTIVSAEKVKEAIKSIPKSENPNLNAARVSRDGNAHFLTYDGGTARTISTPVIEGDYPDIRTVFPSEPPILSVMINAELLYRVAKYAKDNASAAGDYGINLEFVDPFTPVRFGVVLPDGRVAQGALMPLKPKFEPKQ
jgi:DNA polymerase III sliding clamp (beta) subunit (PCNA family)